MFGSPMKIRSGKRVGIAATGKSPRKEVYRSAVEELINEKPGVDVFAPQVGLVDRPPIFDGSQTTDVERWNRELDSYMVLRGIAGMKKFDTAKNCLLGPANAMYRIKESTYDQGNDANILKLLTDLKTSFESTDKLKKQKLFVNAEIEPNETCLGWILAVQVLAMDCGLVDTSMIKARIIGGLPEEFQREFSKLADEDLDKWEQEAKLIDDTYDLSNREEVIANEFQDVIMQQFEIMNEKINQIEIKNNEAKKLELEQLRAAQNPYVNQFHNQNPSQVQTQNNQQLQNNNQPQVQMINQNQELQLQLKNLEAQIAKLSTNPAPNYNRYPRISDEDYKKIVAQWYTSTGEPICVICSKVGHKKEQCPLPKLGKEDYMKKLIAGPQKQVGFDANVVEIEDVDTNQIEIFTILTDLSNSLKLRAKVFGNLVDVLVDSGATHTLIHQNLVPEGALIEPFKGVGQGAGGQLTIRGKITTQILLDNEVLEHSFIVTNSINNDVLLGLDFLKKFKLVMDDETRHCIHE